jgi:PAS domain S-box-containing protein
MQNPANTATPGTAADERALAGIIDIFPDALFVVNREYTILDVNAAFEARFGKPRQESIGVNMYDLLESVQCRPEVVTGLMVKGEEVLLSGESFCFDDEADGIWSRYTINPIGAADGSVARLFFMIQDITAQKRDEQKAQIEVELKRLLLDLLPACTFIIDGEGRLIKWNEYARTVIFGKPEPEMLGTDPFDCVFPDDKNILREKLMQVLISGNTEIAEARILLHGGPEFIWGIIHAKRVFIDGDACVLVAGMDIDERKKLEEALTKSLVRWDSILQKWHIGLWEIDIQKKNVERTVEHDRIFGYDTLQPEWQLETFFDHVIPEDRAGIERYYRDLLSNNRAEWSYECRILRTDGEVRWISTVGGLKCGGTGKPIHIQGVVQDITDRKQAELANQHLQSLLQQSQKMELVGQLAGGIAHDFNNVLTAILGNTEILLNKFDEGHPAYENLEIIGNSAKRSADMVRQLLGFARKQMVKPKIIDLDTEVGNLRTMLRQLISENIRLQWHFEGLHARILVDPSQLAQIVTNLVVNARDAITDNGTIIVSTASVKVARSDCDAGHPCMSPGNFVRLSISDNGSGIDKNNLAHIFEPYFTTKDIGKGTGLGLSTVYGIVKQNGGYVDCQSDEGTGSIFSIWLPEYLDRPVEEKDAATAQPDRKNSETILLVEDDSSILKLFKEVLENKGFSVLSARDAEMAESLAAIHGDKIALLITDIVLPRMNGIQLGNKIHESGLGLRILYMSGYTADIIDCQELFHEEVNFIAKPFSIDEFVATVYRMLSQH